MIEIGWKAVQLAILVVGGITVSGKFVMLIMHGLKYNYFCS